MRLLTGNDVSSILLNLNQSDARKLLDALSAALVNYSTQQNAAPDQQTIHQPLRSVLKTQDGNTTLTMPVSDSVTTTVKVATVPRQGDIQGAITIYSPVGHLLGVLNAAEITAFRTALASMTIITRWKQPEKPNVVVFGAGKQAEWHIRLALLLLSNAQRITVINRTSKRLNKFADDVLASMKQAYGGVEIETLSQDADGYENKLAEYLDRADLICCCTPSTQPLFTLKHLTSRSGKRRFLSLIGSYRPDMQEIDGSLIRSPKKVYVDSKSACLEEAGELIKAGMGEDDLIEVGELFDEKTKATLDSGADLTIFKCVGMAIMDSAVANELLKIAEEGDKGTVIEQF
jgi:ornithine cyclodeaminase/alanine dehydrogenase-like protein (mu-crystallin family)